jgi:hypothetical protein
MKESSGLVEGEEFRSAKFMCAGELYPICAWEVAPQEFARLGRPKLCCPVASTVIICAVSASDNTVNLSSEFLYMY